MEVNLSEFSIEHEEKRFGEPKKLHHKIYIWIGKESIIENLFNRRNRPYEDYKKFVIPKIMEHLRMNNPDKYELLKDAKWSWNQNCGCSMCPCSPGFVSVLPADYSTHQTIHVTI